MTLIQLTEGGDHYLVDGEEFDRVTRVLNDAGVTDWRNDPMRELWMARGTSVMKALQFIIEGRFDRSYLTQVPEYAPYILAGERFINDPQVEVLACEVPLFSRELRLAGRCDLVVRFQGRLAVPDIKLTKAQRSTKIQTAFYQMMIRSLAETTNYPFAREYHSRFAVELYKTGKFKCVWYDDDQEDQATALAALRIIRWQREGR